MKHQIQLQVPAGALPLVTGLAYILATLAGVMFVATERWSAALAAILLLFAIGPIFAYSYGRWLDHTDVQGARAAADQRRDRPHWSRARRPEPSPGPDDGELDGDEPGDEPGAAQAESPRPAWAGPHKS